MIFNLSWPKKSKPVPKPAPRPVAPYRHGWTLDHFRSQPDRCDAMREFLRSPLGQQMMSVLQHELPLDSIEAVRAHRLCLRMIELMAESPAKPNDDIEATYGAEKEFPDQPQTETETT